MQLASQLYVSLDILLTVTNSCFYCFVFTDVLDVSNTPPVLLTSSLTTARSSIFVTTTTVVHSPTDIPTSKSSYFVTSTTASSFVSITATILPSINTQTDNGGSSSSIAVVIAGCALGVILSIIIVVLIISLAWYHRRRRKNKGNYTVIIYPYKRAGDPTLHCRMLNGNYIANSQTSKHRDLQNL